MKLCLLYLVIPVFSIMKEYMYQHGWALLGGNNGAHLYRIITGNLHDMHAYFLYVNTYVNNFEVNVKELNRDENSV
jgi:hypothetical protein